MLLLLRAIALGQLHKTAGQFGVLGGGAARRRENGAGRHAVTHQPASFPRYPTLPASHRAQGGAAIRATSRVFTGVNHA